MGLFDKIKKAGSDLMKDGDIMGKIRKGEVLTEEELSFFNEKHPNETQEEIKQKYDDQQTLKQHKAHKIGGLKFFTDERGYYYFSNSKELAGERYYLVGFDWAGPQYKVTSTTVTTGQDKQKGKKASTLGGAAIGSLMGPVGTMVGAAVGASGKKKTDINRKSETTSTQEELDTTAYLIFIEKDDKRIKKDAITCNSTIAKEVNSLTFTSEATALGTDEITTEPQLEITDSQVSVADEIRKFKELLDEGIISQEDFDAKKKELLGL